MKPIPGLLAGAFLVTACAASEPALPEFNSKLAEQPPLSLQDVIKGGTLKSFQFAPPAKAVALNRKPASGRKVTRVGGMPVLEPDPKVDYKIVAKAPDPSVDYKMIVKSPEVPAATTRE